MITKSIIYGALALLLISTYGCVALVAGAAGGAGTVVWLSGKLSQELNASLPKSLEAAKSAMRSLDLDITRETVKDDVAQLTGDYYDSRPIWIDIHRLSDMSSRIEVRVGAPGDKEAARKILNQIRQYL